MDVGEYANGIEARVFNTTWYCTEVEIDADLTKNKARHTSHLSTSTNKQCVSDKITPDERSARKN